MAEEHEKGTKAVAMFVLIPTPTGHLLVRLEHILSVSDLQGETIVVVGLPGGAHQEIVTTEKAARIYELIQQASRETPQVSSEGEPGN